MTDRPMPRWLSFLLLFVVILVSMRVLDGLELNRYVAAAISGGIGWFVIKYLGAFLKK